MEFCSAALPVLGGAAAEEGQTMADKLNVVAMGGQTKGFHEFPAMGPIYRQFLSAAGFEVKSRRTATISWPNA